MSAPLVIQFVDLHGDFLMQLAINRVPNIPPTSKPTYGSLPSMKKNQLSCRCCGLPYSMWRM
uniref:Uncharacterized protein n=1 Tax=Romanomermis culicivorax TaxID=13658 RepID=A0A915JBG0_ROMCU